MHKHDDQDVAVSDRLKNMTIEHPGKNKLRTVVDSFEISGPHGAHICLLYEPLELNFTGFLKTLPDNRFPKEMAQSSPQLIVLALDYLHRCYVVHTGISKRNPCDQVENTDTRADISPNNILQDVEDHSVLTQLEEAEIEQPSERKTLQDRFIYTSRQMPLVRGLPVLCDLGEARIGNQKHTGDIMPAIYRAPEVILGMS